MRITPQRYLPAVAAMLPAVPRVQAAVLPAGCAFPYEEGFASPSGDHYVLESCYPNNLHTLLNDFTHGCNATPISVSEIGATYWNNIRIWGYIYLNREHSTNDAAFVACLESAGRATITSSKDTGAIVGGVIGGVAGAAIIGVVIFLCYKKYKG